MMRKILLCLLLPLMGMSLVSAQPMETWPSWKEVVSAFYSGYGYRYNTQRELHFARKPDGWYVMETIAGDAAKVVRSDKMWDAEEQLYLPLKQFSDSSSAKGNLQEMDFYMQYNEGKANGFDRAVYFGYVGWEDDVIAEYKNREDLSDEELEGLARAYSSLAVGLLRRQYDYPRVSEEEAVRYEKIDETRLKTCMKNLDAAISIYERLWEQNPNYETVVGDIRLKYANEHVSAYHLLMSVKEEKLAKKYLKEGVYAEVDLEYGRNLLNECEPDAFLFTAGDTDTYLTWYLQETEGFRQDVTVSCVSLLYASYEIDRLRETQAFPLSIPKDMYQGTKLFYVPIEPNPEPQLLSQVMDSIVFHGQRSRGEAAVCPTKRLLLPSSGDTLVLELRSSYLDRSNLILLDLIVENNWERPIYFPSASYLPSFPGLVPYFALTGLNYRLMNQEQDGSTYQTAVDKEALEANLEKLITTEWESNRPNSPQHKLLLLNGYGQHYARLVEAYLAEEEKEKAKSLSLQFLEKVELEELADLIHTYHILDALYQTGEEKQAKKIVEGLMGMYQAYDYRTEYRKVQSGFYNCMMMAQTLSNWDSRNSHLVQQVQNHLGNLLN